MGCVGEYCRKTLGWHLDETYESMWRKIGNQKIKGRKWNRARNFQKRIVWSAYTVKPVWHMTVPLVQSTQTPSHLSLQVQLTLVHMQHYTISTNNKLAHCHQEAHNSPWHTAGSVEQHPNQTTQIRHSRAREGLQGNGVGDTSPLWLCCHISGGVRIWGGQRKRG